MSRLLIISFDILREHDPAPAFSIASLLAYAQNHKIYRSGDLTIRHHAFNLYKHPDLPVDEAIEDICREYPVQEINFIALSVYVWSEQIVVRFMPALREKGFIGKYILGGYQITATDSADLAYFYPGADYFLKGYAELSLLRAITENMARGKIFEDRPDFDRLPSIYLSGTIELGVALLHFPNF